VTGLGAPLGFAGLAYCECGPDCAHERPLGIHGPPPVTAAASHYWELAT
jgi:hypothetical protein